MSGEPILTWIDCGVKRCNRWAGNDGPRVATTILSNGTQTVIGDADLAEREARRSAAEVGE